MPTILVYHAKNPTFSNAPPVKVTNENFTLVATVNTDDLDRAFTLTNHITGPWEENEGVKAHVGRNRSTSVGDVFVVFKPAMGRTPATLEAFMVGACGWIRMGGA